MLNFIICEEENTFVTAYKKIIDKIMMKKKQVSKSIY